jgi:hypothetical protein
MIFVAMILPFVVVGTITCWRIHGSRWRLRKLPCRIGPTTYFYIQCPPHVSDFERDYLARKIAASNEPVCVPFGTKLFTRASL